MLGWAVPFRRLGQPFPFAPLGVERSLANVLKAKAYGLAGARTLGAVQGRVHLWIGESSMKLKNAQRGASAALS